MAKTWYPVVDYAACTECGTCSRMCPHGVYDLAKAPSPVVKNPLACVDHCHGCGNSCPAGAIVYVGEDTGWAPPHSGETCGSCTCGDSAGQKALVEYLYLDLKTCDRCIGTDKVLEAVLAALAPALALAGYAVEYKKVEMATTETAERYRFLSSPTIRVNGRDICASVAENSCGCCSAISGTDVDCRIFQYHGESYEVPPEEMLAEAVLKAVFAPPESGCACGGYTLPENLKIFFAGKKAQSCCSCC
jgi:NAD-dependent dihydropyrimidine dehydrogenase PreA subunit